jgi:hypothetical protein
MSAYRKLWSLSAGLCCAGILGAAVTLADESPLDKLLPPKDSLAQPKLIVLKSGQVLQGEITGQIGGYAVHSPTGSMIVQYEDVWTSATSLEDAYRRMAANVRNPTANDRVKLAQWCVNAGLRDSARQELLAALVLEPDRLDAKRLLLQIESQRTSSTPAGRGVDVTLPTAMTRPRDTAPTAQVAREQMAEFTRRVQPLLLNTCGNAACHGGDQAGDFHLRPTARLSRLDTAANLQELMRWMDAVNPDNSPLLTEPRQLGGVHAGLFRGPKGQEQFHRLAQWTHAVAPQAGVSRAAAPAHTPGAILPAAASTPATGTAWPVMTAAAPSAFPPSTSGSGTQAEASRPADHATTTSHHRPADVNDAFLRKLLDESRPDAFDPEVFNRRVHGAESGRSPPATR